MRYAVIAENRLVFAVRAMCRMLAVHPSGFYAWLREPFSQRALEDQRQTKLMEQAWDDSGKVYGYPLAGRRLFAITVRRKLHDDLCEDISPNRVWRLARLAGIRAQIGYQKAATLTCLCRPCSWPSGGASQRLRSTCIPAVI